MTQMPPCLARAAAPVALAAALAMAPAGAGAQSDPDLIHLQDRVERIEARLQLFGLDEDGVEEGGGEDGGLSMRVGRIEEELRQLHGQVEELAHALRRIETRLGSSGESTELGGGQGTSPSSRDAQPRLTLDPDQPEQRQLGDQPRILGQVPGQPLDLSGGAGDSSVDYGGRTTGTFGGPSTADFDRIPQVAEDDDGARFAAVPTGDPREDYDRAYGHVLRGDFDTAEVGFRQFLASHPDDELSGNAQYWLGESLFARGRYRDAADAFLAGYTDYPDGAKAPDSLFKLGMSLKELGERDAACASLAEIEQRYPEAPQAVQERARGEMDRSGC